MTGGIDLHTHSTVSDGSKSPGDLVRLAKAEGLSAVALTDHDTVAGLPEAVAAGVEAGIEVVPGVELSVDAWGKSLHVVGLWLPERPGPLADRLAELRTSRGERNEAMVARLQAAGVDVTIDDVLAEAGGGEGGAPGRPHIAQALVRKGYATTYQGAFEKYLGSRGAAYVPKAKPDAADAIGWLKAEGGLAVLAHPFLYKLTNADLEKLLLRLKDAGLDALEVHYPEHSTDQTRTYLQLARKLDLGVSGGSDYHGDIKPSIRIGRGKGDLSVPVAVLDALKERLGS